jgi:hypothetical protein
MTEAEWLASDDPDAIAKFPFDGVGDRKLRLFACACCRRVWQHMTDECCRRAVELAEEYADGRATAEVLSSAHNDALLAEYAAQDVAYNAGRGTDSAESFAAEAAYHASGHRAFIDEGAAAAASAAGWDDSLRSAKPGWGIERRIQAHYLRDIFGNPFRPVIANPSWLTSTVTALARGIYADRAFDRLPILADALQDAGCDHHDILAHCRDTQLTHVRGCWVVDLVLGLS